MAIRPGEIEPGAIVWSSVTKKHYKFHEFVTAYWFETEPAAHYAACTEVHSCGRESFIYVLNLYKSKAEYIIERLRGA